MGVCSISVGWGAGKPVPSALSFGHSVMLGGGPPVFFHISICPASSLIMAESISLASFLRSAGTPFGIAQPQISFHDVGFCARGPTGNGAMPTLPAIFERLGSLNSPKCVESTSVKAASPAMKIAFASLRPYAVMPGGLILWVLIASHQYSTISRWQGSVTAGSNFAAASLSFSRSNSGLRMSQLFDHMVHHRVNQVLFIDIPPT